MRDFLIKAQESRQIVDLALADTPGWWTTACILTVYADAIRYETMDKNGEVVGEEVAPIASVLRMRTWSRERAREHLERCMRALITGADPEPEGDKRR